MLLAITGLLLAFVFPAFRLVDTDLVLEIYPYGARGDAPRGLQEALASAPPVIYGTLFVLLAAIAVEIIAVISFKKRPLQIRLLSLANLLVAGLFGLIYYIEYNLTHASPSAVPQLQAGLICLLVAPICNLLAMRGVRRDEQLVRGMHRLR
jgi:hypothetical protein